MPWTPGSGRSGWSRARTSPSSSRRSSTTSSAWPVEADRRIEHRADDYQAFKDDHAARGAELAGALLEEVGVDAETRRRTARLIAGHEHAAAPGDPDAGAIALLNDADALSFFSLNSMGYLDYFGPEATRRKVAYTLRRLRPEARRHLDGMRLRPVGRGGNQRPSGGVA